MFIKVFLHIGTAMNKTSRQSAIFLRGIKMYLGGAELRLLLISSRLSKELKDALNFIHRLQKVCETDEVLLLRVIVAH